MTTFKPGLVHAPVTPFKADGGLDLDTYGKLIDFHIRQHAAAIAVPMHWGEAVSLPDREKREVIAFAVKQAGKVPVIAHVSDSGTAIAASLAAFAEKAGAAAIVSTTPYYWTPPPAMLLEHLAGIAKAVRIPFLVHNAPEDMAGVKVNAELCCKLIDRAPNFAGVVDATLDWQFMIELMTDAPPKRSDFQLLTSVEYLVSAGAIGATGIISGLAGVAPRRVRQLYELVRDDKLVEARRVQEDLAALRQLLKPLGIGGLKAMMRIMARDVGDPRRPLEPMSEEARKALHATMRKIDYISGEPHGW